MKISYRWLARHVDLDGVDAERVAAELTMSTAEVEGVERFAPQLSAVTVGHVLVRDQHPDADKLSLCTVDVGRGEPLKVVCGAPNVAAGQKVAVATVGTVLPGGLAIKKAKIRGVESHGMICSERELGLGEESGGIWVLDADARVGEPVARALALEDWVIEIDNKSITHRPDLWGHRGVAREVAAILRRELKPLEPKLPRAEGGRPFPVRVETPLCSRYLALAIDGAKNGVSPRWLKTLLLAVGHRPIDLFVDLSNFVMLDLGEPNHLFDRRRLSPEGIVVRMARAGERMTTLDGVERALQPSDMLICSGDRPVALAGVMGGEDSKVGADTTELVLEAATFHPATVRRTATRLALRTDSSARFEKSLDPTLPPLAAAHFFALLAAEQPGVRAGAAASDAGEWKDPSRVIALRGSRVRKLLGAEVPDAEIADILGRLQFGVEARGDSLAVRVPSFRATKDVTIEQDLVEEVGRVHRYGRIAERALAGELAPPPRDEAWRRRMLVRKVEDRLALAARFRQTIGYSFVPDRMLAALGLEQAAHIEVENAIDAGSSRVRRSVVPSVLALLEPNRRRRGEVRLFELGKGYEPRDGGEPHEVHEVALALCRAKSKDEPRFDRAALSIVRGVVEDLFSSLGLERCAWKEAGGAIPSWANPGRCLFAVVGANGALAGEAAALDPGVARALGLSGDVESETAVARLSIDALLAAPERRELYRPIPQFPETLVDVAIALPDDQPAGRVREAIEKAGGRLVASLELFDVYSGGALGSGKKSLAWHVALQASDRTLTDQDVKRFLERVEREAAAIGGELRRA
jgi:phenylalanyl-tRNA synthetase beta chain